jgi:hypothetical protein
VALSAAAKTESFFSGFRDIALPSEAPSLHGWIALSTPGLAAATDARSV